MTCPARNGVLWRYRSGHSGAYRFMRSWLTPRSGGFSRASLQDRVGDPDVVFEHLPFAAFETKDRHRVVAGSFGRKRRRKFLAQVDRRSSRALHRDVRKGEVPARLQVRTMNSIGPPISALTVGRSASISSARSAEPRGGVTCAAASGARAKPSGAQTITAHNVAWQNFGGHRGGGRHFSGHRGGGTDFAAPRGHARSAIVRGARSGGGRAHFDRRSRIAAPTLHGPREMRAARSIDRAAARARTDRGAERALRGGPVNSRAAALATRTFAGRNAQIAAGRAFAPGHPRDRFDPARFGRLGFAGAFWPGPYFWPYAYHDETFWLWPSSYDAMFWSYGYDDLLYGIYRSYDPAFAVGSRPTRRARLAPQANSLADWCGQAAPGLTDWPVDEIAAAVNRTRSSARCSTN